MASGGVIQLKAGIEMIERLSVIGLGKLGAPIAASMAHGGFEVVGVDTDTAKVTAIKRQLPPVIEPGLAELLHETQGRFTATTDLATAVQGSDATFVIVPTPSEADGRFSLRSVLTVCQKIGQALRRVTRRHLVVITSTVMPGDCGGVIRETLEHHSGKRIGEDLGLCYSPEFVALGSVIHDFLHPELVLIGQSDPWAGDRLEHIALRVAQTTPHVQRMTFVNAELAKLAVNTYVTTKITYANMLAEICQQLPGADVDVVTQAIGHDSRIGQAYLRGGLGYGGPCFPRDNIALTSLANRYDSQAELAETVDKINRSAVDRLAKLILSQVCPGQTVAVLGLAYKPNTDVVDQSQGLLLAAHLSWEGVNVVAYDPLAHAHARRLLPGSVHVVDQLSEAIDVSDVLVVATPWQEFVDLDPIEIAIPGAERRLVVDCWRCLDPQRIEPVADYLAVGIGPHDHHAQVAVGHPATKHTHTVAASGGADNTTGSGRASGGSGGSTGQDRRAVIPFSRVVVDSSAAMQGGTDSNGQRAKTGTS